METLNDAAGLTVAEERVEDEIIQIEIEREGSVELITLEVREQEDLLGHVRGLLDLEVEVHLFERDKAEPLVEIAKGRRALRLVAHKHRQITVRVRYEHMTKEETVPPSRTVFKVLQWAVSKHAFNLDPMQAAKANLILPGADAPMARDSAIGSFTHPGEHMLVVDLTLKDFTNG
jgi:hypothetical protein